MSLFHARGITVFAYIYIAEYAELFRGFPWTFTGRKK